MSKFKTQANPVKPSAFCKKRRKETIKAKLKKKRQVKWGSLFKSLVFYQFQRMTLWQRCISIFRMRWDRVKESDRGSWSEWREREREEKKRRREQEFVFGFFWWRVHSLTWQKLGMSGCVRSTSALPVGSTLELKFSHRILE